MKQYHFDVPPGCCAQVASAGVLLKAENPTVYFRESPQKVVGFFVCAARLQACVEITSFEAARKELGRLKLLSPMQIMIAVDTILQSACPDALAPLLAENALASFGLPCPRGCLSTLRTAPQNRCARWALLLRLCGTCPQDAVRLLPLYKMLAVSPALLRREGIRGYRCARILPVLTQAVLREPLLNRYDILVCIAHGLLTV